MSTDPSPPTDPWHQTIPAKTILAGTVASETVASETVASETRFGLRRWWLLGGGAITAVAAVTAFLVTLLWPAAAATPLEFRALEPVATVTVSEDLRVERARTPASRGGTTATTTTPGTASPAC